MCANNLTPTNNNFTTTTTTNTTASPTIPFDSCVPKNIRFYFNALKAISAYYPPTAENNLPKQQHYELNNDTNIGEYNCLKDGTGVGSKYVGNLINNNNNICYNSWKRAAGLINIKRTAGLVTPAKHNYSD